jgi:NHS family xanthosine MFS transporter
MQGGILDWKGIWLCFAGYSLVVAILFAMMFRHEHVKEDMSTISH